MPNTITATMPSAVEITEIGDPAMANGNVDFLDGDVVQLQSAPLKARQIIVRLDGCILVHYATNARVRSRPMLLNNYVGYLTFGPDARGTVNGLPVRHDMMLAAPASTAIGVVADAGYESMAFLLRPQDVGAQWQASGHDEVLRWPEKAQALHVGPGLAGQLFAWGKRLVDAAVAEPELFNGSLERRAAAQQDLIKALRTTLASTQKLAPRRQERTAQTQSEIVRAAEKHALAHGEDRPYVADLCRVAGVSERTLEYAFRAVMGLSPTAYLTRTRLHRVRRSLWQARPGATTVTAEALNWGFWHFGEFSKAYKNCFDESPSDTLKRMPSQRPWTDQPGRVQGSLRSH